MKTRKIFLGLVPIMAASAMAGGCGSRRQISRTCVDDSQTAVDQQNCHNEDDRHSHGYTGSYGYHWYYFYDGRPPYTPGTRVDGGTYVMPSGASFSGGSGIGSVERGGFGSTSAGHGAGE
jgi:hypothetical protein